MSTPPREVRRADALYEVERDDKKFGTLEISNGSLVWFPAYTNYGFKVSWKKFHEIFFDGRKCDLSRKAIAV